MSLHAIEIAAVVVVAIMLCRFYGLLCRNTKPLAAKVSRRKMQVQHLLKTLTVIALNPPEYMQLVRIACL